MVLNRILYLVLLAALFGFRISYPFGIGVYLFYLLLLLPLFSLGFSLLQKKRLRIVLSLPESLPRGEKAVCSVYFPPDKGRFAPFCKLTYRLTDFYEGTYEENREQLAGGLRLDVPIPSSHCTSLQLSLTKCRGYDLLGLFSYSIPIPEPVTCRILPISRMPVPCPDFSDLSETSFRPKAGGGFAEVHEFREYQPGDNVREINWKLTAKTDTTIIREPQVPVSVPVIICLDLRGSREETDLVLDNLIWTANALFEKHVSLAVCYPDNVTHAQSLAELPDENALRNAVKTILSVFKPQDVPVNYSRLPNTARLIRLGPPEKREEVTG